MNKKQNKKYLDEIPLDDYERDLEEFMEKFRSDFAATPDDK